MKPQQPMPWATKRCPQCDGSGVVEIHEHLQETLVFVRRAGGPVTTRQVADQFGIRISTAYERLMGLRGSGMIERLGTRKEYRWKVTP